MTYLTCPVCGKKLTKIERSWRCEKGHSFDEAASGYLHLLPSKSLNKAYLNTIQSVPETIFVDENGNQIGERYLGAKSKAEWQKIIDSLIP